MFNLFKLDDMLNNSRSRALRELLSKSGKLGGLCLKEAVETKVDNGNGNDTSATVANVEPVGTGHRT